MNSTLKTFILAATAAAVIASPALARTKRAAGVQYVAPIAQSYQGGQATWQSGQTWQGTLNSSNDQFGQIRGEYLKDAPMHNGNNY